MYKNKTGTKRSGKYVGLSSRQSTNAKIERQTNTLTRQITVERTLYPLVIFWNFVPPLLISVDISYTYSNAPAARLMLTLRKDPTMLPPSYESVITPVLMAVDCTASAAVARYVPMNGPSSVNFWKLIIGHIRATGGLVPRSDFLGHKLIECGQQISVF